MNPEWKAVRAKAEADIADALTRLELPGLAQAETEFQRGRINALREILALATPRPRLTDTNLHYS